MEIVYYKDVKNSKLFNNYLTLLEKVKHMSSADFLSGIKKGIEVSDGNLSLFFKKDPGTIDFAIEASTQDNYKTICIWITESLKGIKPLFWDLVASFIIHECTHIKRHELFDEDQETGGLEDEEYLLDKRELNAYAVQSLYAKELGIIDFADDQYYEYGDDDIYETFTNCVIDISD